jgi:predicted N-acetyltransferase YhbS
MNRTQSCGEARQNRAGHVEIRPACAGDHDAVRAFLGDLSLRTRYLRFFTGGGTASHAMVAMLLGSGDNADAMLATDGETVVGHAMATDAAGPLRQTNSIEIGVMVADDWQGCGVGSALIREVTARAQARGVTTVVMEVLAENRRVLEMIARRWPAAQRSSSGPYVTIRAELRGRIPAGQMSPHGHGVQWREPRSLALARA